jgi:hypothetical protein
MRYLPVLFLIFFFSILSADEDIQKKEDNIVYEVRASLGDSTKDILINWKFHKADENFIIFRSKFEEGLYEKAGESKNTRFIDNTAEMGVKYWYRISYLKVEMIKEKSDDEKKELNPPIGKKGSDKKEELDISDKQKDINGEEAEKIKLEEEKLKENLLSYASPSCFGYRKFKKLKRLKYNNAIRVKNKRKPRIKSAKKRRIVSKILETISEYYINRIKLMIMMRIGKSYIKKGVIVLVKDFDSFEIIDKDRMIHFYKDGAIIKFYSKRIWKLFDKLRGLKNSDKIIHRLLENAMLFTVYRGDEEVALDDGTQKFLHKYEVLGLATEYYKNYKNWQANTILIGSSNKKLKDMIKEAERRNN